MVCGLWNCAFADGDASAGIVCGRSPDDLSLGGRGNVSVIFCASREGLADLPFWGLAVMGKDIESVQYLEVCMRETGLRSHQPPRYQSSFPPS